MDDLKSISRASLDEHLRDQLIISINNDEWQRELIRSHASGTASFTDVEKSALLLESVATQQKQIQSLNKTSSNPLIAKIQKRHKSTNVLKLNRGVHCFRCGGKTHKSGETCPATGQVCRACNKQNHFAKACLISGNAVVYRGVRRVQGNSRGSYRSDRSRYSSDSDSSGSSGVHRVRTAKHSGSQVMLDVTVNNSKLKMLYDPGACKSIISENVWQKLGSPQLQPTNNLTAYTGHSIKTLGKFKVKVQAFERTKILPLVVVKGEDVPLFGLD